MKVTQIGWPVIGITLLLPIALRFLGGAEHLYSQPAGWVVPGVALLIVLTFGWLTTEVTATDVRIRFGIGLVRRAWPLADVAAATPVRNSAWTGWGIRVGYDYTLYNVSGLDAVQLSFHDGRSHVRIGTDQPAELAAAIEGARAGSAVAKM